MKQIFITLLLIGMWKITSAQVLYPNNYREYGAEIGSDLTLFPGNGVYNNTNRAGYTFGLWGRQNWGPYGFQTAVYITDRNLYVKDNTFTHAVNRASFTSVDIPLLFNYKLEVAKLRTRVYSGPLFSFAFIQRQDYPSTQSPWTPDDFVKLNYNTINTAWVTGLGVDINKLTIDARYEGGINKISYSPLKYSHTRMSVVELTFGYSIYPF